MAAIVGPLIGYFGRIPAAVGLGAVVLLVVLLTIEEVLRASDKRRWARPIAALNIAIVPLLIVFGLVVGLRLAQLLQLF